MKVVTMQMNSKTPVYLPPFEKKSGSSHLAKCLWFALTAIFSSDCWMFLMSLSDVKQFWGFSYRSCPGRLQVELAQTSVYLKPKLNFLPFFPQIERGFYKYCLLWLTYLSLLKFLLFEINCNLKFLCNSMCMLRLNLKMLVQ